MAFNGSGVFNRLYSWQQDAANGIKIRADRMDNEDNGFATGLTTCVTRDGQSPATANLPMGGFKHIGVDDGSEVDEYATVGQVVNENLTFQETVGGTGDAITLVSQVPPLDYFDGQWVEFFAIAANTGAVTINRDGLGAKALRMLNGAALTAGLISDEQLIVAVYDDNNGYFVWLNGPSPIIPASSITGVLGLAHGGTNATDAAGARTSLGVAIGSDVQAYSAILASLVAAGGTANRIPYLSGANTYALTPISTDGRNWLNLADPAAMRTYLSLGTAALQNTGAFDAAGAAAAAQAAAIASANASACQRASNLSDLANAATARGNLGIGSIGPYNLTVQSGGSPSTANGMITMIY